MSDSPSHSIQFHEGDAASASPDHENESSSLVPQAAAPVSALASASSSGAAASPSAPQQNASLEGVRLHVQPGEQPHPSPDVTITDDGEAGFVPQAAIRRSLSQTARRPSLAPGTAIEMQSLVAKDAAPVAVIPAVSPVSEEKSSTADELLKKGGPMDEGAVAPPADALWILTNAEMAQKFAESQINVDAPKLSKGLTSAEAATRLARDGRNELKPPKEHSEFVKYLLQFTDPFMLLLLAAGILSAAVAYPIDTSQQINLYIGIILWVVVFISCTFSYIQEGKASSVMASFKNMLPAQAKVIRDGREQGIAAAEIVVGDLLMFGTGDVVPADCRLIWTQDCKVETSSLTGESLPITCSTKSPDTEKIEQAKNVCFNSSKCLEGESLGVVFATGDKTLIGQIAGMAGQTKQEDTTLQKEIKHFVKRLTIFSVCMGVIFFAIALARRADPLQAFINTFIVVMIANVPEGLPMTVVSCLPEVDTRVLTDRGFLFLGQIESLIAAGEKVLFASYDIKRRVLQYVPGKLVINNRPPSHLVDFTQSATRAAWEGTGKETADRNDLSLRVTPDHDMFVQVGDRPSDDKETFNARRFRSGIDMPFVKMKAAELTPGHECACFPPSACPHHRTTMRMLGAAKEGVAFPPLDLHDSDPTLPMAALKLTTRAQLDAFLELYGQ
jgi:hypothetical protein